MIAPEHVSLDLATPRDSELLSRLLELYLHDSSEIFPIELGPDGRFGYDRVPLYWSEPERRFPFLIRADGRIAGFALVARGSPASDDLDVLDVAEFFVLRGYCRSGVGRRAARELWTRLPGRWIVRVAEGNERGLPFWSRVISDRTNGAAEVDTRPGSPHAWRVFSFQIEELAGDGARHRPS